MARLVITMDGGLIHHNMLNQAGVKVMVIDFGRKNKKFKINRDKSI